MKRQEQYKYLGFLQKKRTEIKTAKEHLADAMKDRLKTILKTKLSAINIAKTINTFVLPPLTAKFGIIPYTRTELD